MTRREAAQALHTLRRAGFQNCYTIPLADGRVGVRLSSDYGARVCFDLDDVRAVAASSARVGRHLGAQS